MLPTQDENRQISSNSALADNLDVFPPSNILGPVDALRHQIEGIDLGEIAGAERQIGRIEAPLRRLEYTLGIVAILIRCQDKIHVEEEKNIQVLEHLGLEVLRRPWNAYPLLEVANPTPRSIHGPGHETAAGGAQIVLPAAKSEFGSLSTPAHGAAEESLTANDELPPIEAPVEYATPPALLPQPVESPSHVPESPGQQNNGASMAPVESLDSTPGTDNGTTEGRNVQAKTVEPAPQTNDFDTKLLDDLIKNYGEFAANPNLPATLGAQGHELGSEEKPRLPRLNKAASTRNPKHFDRQLKKLIQDYGEYDLYASKSGALKTKLRVGAAFVALALVLGGLYYFFAPKNVAAPPASFLQQSTAGEGAVKAREPGSGGANQMLSTPAESTQAAALDDLPKDVK